MKKAIKFITASALSLTVLVTPILASANDIEVVEDVEIVTPIVETLQNDGDSQTDENQVDVSGLAAGEVLNQEARLIETIKESIKFVKTSEFGIGDFNPKTLEITGLDSPDIKSFKVKIYSKLNEISYVYEGSDLVIPKEVLNINTFSDSLDELIAYVDIELTLSDGTVENLPEVYKYNLIRDVSGFNFEHDATLINPEPIKLNINEAYKQNPDKYKITINYDGEVVKELDSNLEEFYLPDIIDNLTTGLYTVNIDFVGYDGILNKQNLNIVVEAPMMSVALENNSKLKLIIPKTGVIDLVAKFGNVSSPVNITTESSSGGAEVGYINLPSFSEDRLFVTIEGVFKYGDASIPVQAGYVHEKTNADFLIIATPSEGGNYEHSFDFTNSHDEDIRGRVEWNFYNSNGELVEVDKFSNLIYDFDYSKFEPGTYILRATYQGTTKEFVTEVLGPEAKVLKNEDGSLGVEGKYPDSQLEWRLTDGTPTLIYEQWISIDGPQKYLKQETIDRYSGLLVFEAIERSVTGRESVVRMEVVSNGPDAPEHKEPEQIDPLNPVIPSDPNDPINSGGNGIGDEGVDEESVDENKTPTNPSGEVPQLEGKPEIPQDSGEHPHTGDATQMVPYAVAMLSSGTLLFALNKRKRDK